VTGSQSPDLEDRSSGCHDWVLRSELAQRLLIARIDNRQPVRVLVGQDRSEYDHVATLEVRAPMGSVPVHDLALWVRHGLGEVGPRSDEAQDESGHAADSTPGLQPFPGEPLGRSVRTMNVQFISSFAVISSDVEASRKLYVDALGLPLATSGGSEYLHSENVEGVKSFGIWPLWQAAEACFGTPDWPADYIRPQASVEFDVASPQAVASAASELERNGYQLVHGARQEPWGQTVARLISAEGLIVGISYVPQFHGRTHGGFS
jgi:catechol 2,3-dioxygenase-like lactoylglutathione lyase family enzyme